MTINVYRVGMPFAFTLLYSLLIDFNSTPLCFIILCMYVFRLYHATLIASRFMSQYEDISRFFYSFYLFCLTGFNFNLV